MHQCSFSIRGGSKHWILIILIIHKIVSYDQNISLIFYVKDGSHVRLPHPSCVYITAQWQYTSEITFLALNPWSSVPSVPFISIKRYSPQTLNFLIFQTHHWTEIVNVYTIWLLGYMVSVQFLKWFDLTY